MRVLRIAPARQLALFTGRPGFEAGCWDGLPERARAEVLVLLARIIARSVLAGEIQDEARVGRVEVGGD